MFVVTVKWKPAFAKECGAKEVCVYTFKDKEMAMFHYDAWSTSKHVSKLSLSQK